MENESRKINPEKAFININSRGICHACGTNALHYLLIILY